MAAQWEQWARRVNVIHGPQPARETNSPVIAGRTIAVRAEVSAHSGDGVIVAQGGREQDSAVHLLHGRAAFDVRVNGKVTRIVGIDSAPASFRLRAELNEKAMVLTVDDRLVARGRSAGLIPVQPKDAMTVGRDELTAAGDYQPPNPLRGTVRTLRVETGVPAAAPARAPLGGTQADD